MGVEKHACSSVSKVVHEIRFDRFRISTRNAKFLEIGSYLIGCREL